MREKCNHDLDGSMPLEFFQSVFFPVFLSLLVDGLLLRITLQRKTTSRVSEVTTSPFSQRQSMEGLNFYGLLSFFHSFS